MTLPRARCMLENFSAGQNLKVKYESMTEIKGMFVHEGNLADVKM